MQAKDTSYPQTGKWTRVQVKQLNFSYKETHGNFISVAMGFLFRLWSVFENTIRIISIIFYFLSDRYMCSQGTGDVIL